MTENYFLYVEYAYITDFVKGKVLYTQGTRVVGFATLKKLFTSTHLIGFASCISAALQAYHKGRLVSFGLIFGSM